MTELLDFAKRNLDRLIAPFGKLDILLFYAIVAKTLEKYLGRRELASRVWISGAQVRFLVKRGSDLKPLSASELVDTVTVEFLRLRGEFQKLSEVRKRISSPQQLIWQYFPPGRLADFFYATNGEGRGRPIDRIFFDLDRGSGVSAEQAREATNLFIAEIKEDEELAQLIGKVRPFVYWTGRSFHTMIFLEEEMPNQFYAKYFHFSKHRPQDSFTGRWAFQVGKELKVKVIGGHEKVDDAITIDPSQTPSGKLCRTPLGSLHMRDAETVDGVSIPLLDKMLQETGLTEELSRLGPRNIVQNLDELAGRLSEQFR